jgi:cell division protein FtsL
MIEQPEAPRRQPAPSRSKRHRQRSSILGRFAFFMLIPFVLYTLYTVAEKSVQTYRLRNQAALVRAELEAEKQENLRLQQELVDARSDQQIEAAARTYLNLVKPGDQAVVLVGLPPKPTPAPRVVEPTSLPDDTPGWLSWLLDQLRL